MASWFMVDLTELQYLGPESPGLLRDQADGRQNRSAWLCTRAGT